MYACIVNFRENVIYSDMDEKMHIMIENSVHIAQPYYLLCN